MQTDFASYLYQLIQALLRNWETLPAVMLCLCDVAESTMPVGQQGLASVSGKRSATGVPADDNGMTFARTPGQVSSSCMRNAIYHCLPVQWVYLLPVPV